MGMDLQTEHERFLTEQVFKTIFVTDYPKEIKAFCAANDDEKMWQPWTCWFRGGEIIGGSQRKSYDVLARLEEMRICPDDYWWYLSRCYGGCKHAGFGLGFDGY